MKEKMKKKTIEDRIKDFEKEQDTLLSTAIRMIHDEIEEQKQYEYTKERQGYQHEGIIMGLNRALRILNKVMAENEVK